MLADAAVALGLPVFPCGADKRPLTDHGFKDASTDPEAIRTAFARTGTAMIGVPTGEMTGFVAVDIDVKDGRSGAAWLDANTHRLPPTRTIRTTSGGQHLYFRWPGPVRNSVGRIAAGVDVRGDGGYVIVPPSPGYSVADDAPVAEAPDWLLPALLAPPEAPSPPPAPPDHPATLAATDGTPYGLSALAKECQAIRSAADGTKHATLNKAAYSIGGLVASGDLDEATALTNLTEALQAIRPACKDFRAAQRTLQRAFAEGRGRPREAHTPIPPEEHPAAPFLAKLARRQARMQAKPLPVPPELFDVDGALGMFVAHCNATAVSPQPFLALAAGICLVGALAGRKYRTATDLRTNIYAIGVADSGGGKDHARKVIKQLLGEAGLTQYMGGEDIASGAAMYTALARHPAVLFQIDEIGDWLADVLGPKAASHRRQIAQRLKTLFSSASTFLSGTEYADQSRNGRPREDIQQPHACLYGTTTPAQLWSAIAGASLHDGLMARILLFVSPCSFPDEQPPRSIKPPDALVAAMQAIAAGPADPQTGELGRLMLATTWPEPVLVPNTPDAEDAYRALRREQLDRVRRHEGTYVTAVVGRWAENAMKLALVRAVSRNPATPVIAAEDVVWGRNLSLHCIETLLREAEAHVADNPFDALLKRARDIIRKHGPISERDMIRRGFTLPERDRADVLRTLIDAGHIAAIEVTHGSKPGRPTVRYATAVATDEIDLDPEVSP